MVTLTLELASTELLSVEVLMFSWKPSLPSAYRSLRTLTEMVLTVVSLAFQVNCPVKGPTKSLLLAPSRGTKVQVVAE